MLRRARHAGPPPAADRSPRAPAMTDRRYSSAAYTGPFNETRMTAK